MGRWTLAALVLNNMIGSGIFGLPSLLFGMVGRASLWVFLVGGTGIGAIMACFAEVASQFPETGGPYLYARVAFGRLLGIAIGWISWLSRLAAAAASSNLFVIYLAEFWPEAKAPAMRFTVLTLLIVILGAINFRGVVAGAKVSNVFLIAKLAPLWLFVGTGALFLAIHGPAPTAAMIAPLTSKTWLQALILVVFAYGGFEGAVISMGEVRDPQRSAPFAILVALGTTALLYTAVQVIVVGVLANPAATDRPLAAAAHHFIGRAGAWLISAGALISIYGYVSSVLLTMPRLPFALAEQGDFPSFFAAVHPVFRTPHVAIMISAALLWLLAVSGSFTWNAKLSVVVRLLSYGTVSAALVVLRHKHPQKAKFRLPAGPLYAALGIFFSLLLVTQVHRAEVEIIGATAVVALVNWFWATRKVSRASG